jgi:hypothetical protein
MANPFPFSSGAVLTAAQLNEIGGYDAWTPAWNNLTLGTGGTNTGFVTEVNDLVVFEIAVILGTSSSVSGSLSFPVPVTAATNLAWGPVGTAVCWDTSAGTFAQAELTIVGQSIFLHGLLASGTWATRGLNINATRPFTWADGDRIYLQGMYRAA